MRIYILLFFMFSGIVSFAQNGNGKDPEARKILEKLSKEYDSYNSMEVTFRLTLDIPDQPTEVQNGKVLQKEDKYILDLKEQAIYCNGEYVWLHLKDNNEVQINDIDEDAEDSFLTPKDMMTLYESDDYEYALVGKETKDGVPLSQIEFKPVDPESEYSKLRLAIDGKKNEMVTIMVFSKDGSKYTLDIQSVISNSSFSDTIFTFDASKFPGIHVEDLRL